MFKNFDVVVMLIVVVFLCSFWLFGFVFVVGVVYFDFGNVVSNMIVGV